MSSSQDIWVRNANDAGTTHQNPEFGQVNYIHVKIRNRGTTTVQNAPVKVYVTSASTGLSWPAQWTYVGEAFVVSLLPAGTTTVVVPWTPAGTGHYCIVARIDAAQDPMTFVETTNITYNTRQNNNVCWKNVNVVNLILSTGGFDLVNASFIFRNVARDTRPLRLTFGEVQGVTGVRAPFLNRGRITVELPGPLAERWRENGGIARGMEQIDDRTFLLRDPAEAYLDFELKAQEEFPVGLVFQDTVRGQRDGAHKHTVRVVQHDLATREEVGAVDYEILASPPL
jgi:hypothetical protein